MKIIKVLGEYILTIKCDNNELLSKAVNYYLNHKEELYTYLDSGYVDISNNLAERVVKPFVIARKSFLFCKTIDGAITTGKLFSLVQTARANGLKSEQYMGYVISNINKKDIKDPLPWSDKLPKGLLISSKYNITYPLKFEMPNPNIEGRITEGRKYRILGGGKSNVY